MISVEKNMSLIRFKSLWQVSISIVFYNISIEIAMHHAIFGSKTDDALDLKVQVGGSK